MGYNLLLDDVRKPIDVWNITHNLVYVQKDWIVVRSNDEFVNTILSKGMPEIISFDHDLSYEDQETWIPIKNYEGIYEISNLGRVRRIKISKGTLGGILLPDKNESGLFVTLRNLGYDNKYLIHRLVLENFIGINFIKPYVNHKDGNRWNNNINNLEWCTNSENVKHSHDNLIREYTAYGENHKNSICVSKYKKDGTYICTYGSVNEAGRQEKIPFTNIAKNAKGKRKTAGGFIWKYDNKKPTINTIIKHIKKEDKNYIKKFFIPDFKEKTGYDSAKWLIDYCLDNNLDLPLCFIHSMNPAGKENIEMLLNNFIKFKQKQ